MTEDFVIEVLCDNIPERSRDAEQLVADVIGVTAYAIKGTAQFIAPYRTGALRSSITAEPRHKYLWEVAPHKDYAIFLEFGTYKMAPRPYMRPAADKHRPAFLQAMAAALGKAADRNSK